VGDEHVVFFETALIQQQLDPLARRQLALGMLTVDPLLAPAKAGLLAAMLKLLQDVLHLSSPSGPFSGVLACIRPSVSRNHRFCRRP